MKRLIRLLLTITTVLTGGMTSVAQSQTDSSPDHFFKKHIMVVVDQSGDAIGETTDMNGLFQGLSNLLKGQEMPSNIDPNKSDLPSNFTFNPETDEISVYAFGLGGIRGGDWYNIHSKASNNYPNYTGEQFFTDITEGLIHPRTSFSTSNKTLDDFISTDLKSVFDHSDPLSKNFYGVTMSHYVYPSILHFINEDGKAEEYYVVVVTNYKDGAGNADGADEQRIVELAGRNSKFYPGEYASRLNGLRRPFYTTNWLQLRNKTNPVNYLNGMQLGVKSLQGVSVYVSSNQDLYQQQLDRDMFTLKPVDISFNKNNTIRIDSIYLKITNPEGAVVTRLPLTIDSEEAEKWFDSDGRKFVLPSQDIRLGDAAKDEDELNFQYVFYSTVVPEGDGKQVPYVFTAQTTVATSDIKFVNDKKTGMVIAVSLGGAFLILLILMALRSRKVRLATEPINFTTRFSETSREEGTVELPCWFYKATDNSGVVSGAILVKGDVSPEHKKLRLPAKTQVLVKVDILEKPEELTIMVNDDRDQIVKEGNEVGFVVYDENDKKTSKGVVKFTLNFRLPSQVSWNLAKVRLKLRYETRTKVAGFWENTQYIPANANEGQEVDFYIKPEIGVGWIGIDPGTSGSCIAIGRGGSITKPNIVMVEVDGENIIPSKLIFDKTSFKNVEDAVPGKDYSYGTNANKNWTARSKNGYQCFQSIKKLLGYQNGDSNKIDIKPGKTGEEVELTGMELAHLLVKGLLNDTDNHLNSLPESTRRSLEPTGERIRRAVVAIPNNYTLPKTLDMVKSVAISGRFEEVRPIFEAEAILCNYLSRTAGSITSGVQNIAVYDMGGATINLTIFKVTFTSQGGSTYYEVKTLGRIGYAVGGDNIDYALMKYIFSLTEYSRKPAEAKEYQENRKVEILDRILDLKKNMIAFANNPDGRSAAMLSSFDAFDAFVYNVTGKHINNSQFMSKFGDAENSEDFTKKLVYQLSETNKEIRKYVKDRIMEVTKEILSYPEVASVSRLDYVIFSGRSVLFPEIKSWTKKGLKQKFSGIKEWEGLSPTEVKTAVAYGACWYGTFNNLVTLENEGVASAYGFKLTENGKSNLHVLIDQNASMKGQSSISNHENTNNNFASDGNIVEFYQVMGSPHSEDLFEEQNRYKINKIGEIPINVPTECILLELKRSNQVDFSVILNSGTKITRTDVNVEDRDITNENDEAYIFATYTPRRTAAADLNKR